MPEQDHAETGKNLRLPDDAPLVTAYAAVKEKLRKATEGALSPEALKELQDKAARLDDLDAASKSEVEKLNDQIATLTKERDGFKAAVDEHTAATQRTKVRDEVAKAKGLNAAVLRGSTKEEFEEHADELIAAGIKPKPVPPADGQGATGTEVAGGEMTAAEIVAAATGRAN